MNQADLIARVTQVLGNLQGVAGAFLGGSFGRGEADAYSDVDVFVVVDPDVIPDALAQLASKAETISPLLLSRTLPNARTINAITVDWLRFDLTVVSPAELAYVGRDELKPLLDPLDILETLPEQSGQPPNPSPETLLEIVHEFIRVLGLSVVVKGRDDLTVAENGVGLMRDMLIRIMIPRKRPADQERRPLSRAEPDRAAGSRVEDIATTRGDMASHGTNARGSAATGGGCSMRGRCGWAGGEPGAQRQRSAGPALGRFHLRENQDHRRTVPSPGPRTRR